MANALNKTSTNHEVGGIRIRGLRMLFSCIASAVATATSASTSVVPSAAAAAAAAELCSTHFVPNLGQWDDETVTFGLRSRGIDIALRESSLTMHLRREVIDSKRGHADGIQAQFSEIGDPVVRGVPSDSTVPHRRGLIEGPVEYETRMLEVTFPGSNAVHPVGVNPLATRFNYFIGDDESRWRSDVSSFSAIIYESIYDGIDLYVLGADRGVLKYEFHCAAGTNHEQIRIQYDGIEALCVNESGDLLIQTVFGTLLDNAPHVWQDIDGQRRSLNARFEALDTHTYTIKLLTTPDPCHPLVIDPEVEWMTYLGGSGVDWGFGIALDDTGAVLVSGHTSSTNFAGATDSYHGGDSDVFVARIHPSGTVGWMTYLGGSSFDLGRGMALNSAGNALLTGWTNSDDFAGANNAYHGGSLDAFVARLSPRGTLDWMTYLGGTADDLGFDIAVDAANGALLTGQAYSTDFEGANNSHHGGAYDAFAARVHSSGAIDWMTYLGGSDQDDANGIAVDSDGAALVAGDTWSTNFEGRINSPLGNRDAFVARVHGSGVIDWMTYLGGSGNEAGYGIALDADGAALTTGATVSNDFFGRNNAHHGGSSGIDGFLARIPQTGTLEWMTYLGGSGMEVALRVATDAAGAALVSGTTESANFEGHDNSFHGVFDAYVARVPASGTIEWMSYVGGSGDDGGFGIAIDRAGDALVTGRTNSTTFVGQTNSFHGGPSWGDAFVLKLPIADSSVVPGDVNGDGVVDVDDLIAVILGWGACADCPPPNCPADVNDDCAVDVDDLIAVILNWGS
jgi:hypothetical protein